MNLHFFMDPLGYYSGQFASNVHKIDPDNNIIVNINHSKIKQDGITYYSGFTSELKEWVASQKAIERVYFHYYNPIFQELNRRLRKMFPEIVSVWTFWGGDFYALPEFAQGRYLAFSRTTQPSNLFRNNILRRLAVIIFYRLRGKVPYNHKRFIESMNQLDYLAIYFKNDYDNVIRYSQSKMRFFKFSYVSLQGILGDIYSWKEIKLGDKIMVGHSADPGLNHFEVIEKLNEIKCTKSVLLPLYYGDADYRTKLLDATKKVDLKFEVVNQYYELSDYNVRLLEVGYAVFNVNHQQAFGNIVTLLWLGVKVFLHRNSAIYIEFKEIGMHIFSIQDISTIQDFEPLSENEKKLNKEILESILSDEVVKEMTLKLLKLNRVAS